MNKLKSSLLLFSSKHPRLWEIAKFLIVGGFATIIDMLIMAVVIFLFNREHFSYNFFDVLFKSNQNKEKLFPYSSVLGTGTGFLCGLVFNYFMSVKVVFEHKDFAKTFNGAVLFAILSIIGLIIHLVGMWVGFEILEINYWIIKIAITVIVLIFNYVTRKAFVFNAKKKIALKENGQDNSTCDIGNDIDK